MSISEETRHELYQRLEGVLGPAAAATLMAHLPPVGWADVATKRDLDHAVSVVEHRLEVGLAEVYVGLADLRTELHVGLADVRTELNVGLADVRTELHKEIGIVHAELGRVRSEMGAQTRTLFLGLAGLQISGIVAVAAIAGVV